MPYDQHWAIKATFGFDFTVIDYKELIKNLVDFGYELDNYQIQEFRSSFISIKKPGVLRPRIKISGGIAEIIDI